MGQFGFGSFVFRLDRFGYNSVRVISGSGLYQVKGSSGRFGFGSVHFELRVTSDQQDFGSVRVISNFGLNRIIMVLDRFGFGLVQFRISVKIGSTFSLVGSDMVSGHWVRVNWIGSLLPGLRVTINICIQHTSRGQTCIISFLSIL